MSFWGELKRRDVFKVAVTYLVASWLIVQVIGVLGDALDLPDLLDTVVVILLAIGFPVALTIAWIYEVTPEGIKVTPTEHSTGHATSRSSKRLTYVLAGLLVIAVTLLAIDSFTLTPSSTQFGAGSRLAVLPCDDLSPDPTNSFFAVGIHEELLNRLSSLGTLDVISRTSVEQYAGIRPPVPQIAAELDVDAVMECSARYAGDRVLLTVQVIDGESDAHMWSESYPADMSDLESLFEIQANLAIDVANALNLNLLDEERERIDRAPTASREAYELYLAFQGMSPFEWASDRALQLVEEALAIDDAFPEAWIAKSAAHFWRAWSAPLDSAQTESDRAVQAAARASQMSSVDKFLAAGWLAGSMYQRGQWVEAEMTFREYALELGRQPIHIGGYGPLKMAVGHFDEALDAFEEQLASDPLASTTAGFTMMAHELLGDIEARQQAYDRGERLYPNWTQTFDVTLLRLGRRDTEGMNDLTLNSIDAIGVAHLDDRAAGLQALRALPDQTDFIGSSVSYLQMSSWAAYFGDSELALQWMTASTTTLPGMLTRAWYPVFDAVRSEPGFGALVEDLGLPEYWDRFGWPPFCERLDDGRISCR